MYNDQMIAIYNDLKKADGEYYLNNNSEFMTDSTYDRLKMRFKQFEQDNNIPEKDRLSINLGKVNVGDGKVNVPGDFIAEGMEDAFNDADMQKYCNKFLADGINEFVVSHKKDGLTAALKYEYGNLVLVTTRGDGKRGEDVTNNFIKRVTNCPHFVEAFKDFKEVTLRGEVTSTFEECKKHGYASARSFASGSLRSSKKGADERELQFSVFSVTDFKFLEEKNYKKLADVYKDLANFGFCVVEHTVLKTPEEISKLRVSTQGQSFDSPLDGLVVAVNDIFKVKGQKSARFAFKFEETEFETTVLDIIAQVGRGGIITPVAIVEPFVSADGGVNERITLSNYTLHKIGIGSTVAVTKRGAIISTIERVINNPQDMKKPDVCPCCGGDVVEYLSQTICKNGRLYKDSTCPESFANKIVHMFSTYGIKGLSYISARKLVDAFTGKGLMVISLYGFIIQMPKAEAILGLNGKTIYDNMIDAMSNISVEQFIMGLGIPGVQGNKSKILMEFTTVPELCSETFNFNNLLNLKDIGEIVASGLADYFNENSEMTMELYKLFEPTSTIIDKVENSVIEGKSIVITGNYKELRRDEFELMLKSYGATLKSSVSAKTDYVIEGTEAGMAKLRDAKAKGVTILSVEEFDTLIKG
jgi:DNA ligase (NAD+)